MSYRKMLLSLTKSTFKPSPISTPSKMKGFGDAASFYTRTLGTQEANPPLFSKATQQSDKLAFVAASSALLVTAIATGYYFGDEIKSFIATQADNIEESVDSFMISYGNQIFLETMSNKMFRESVYNIREAELLHYGISFEDNDKRVIFYRGMSLPTHLDETDPIVIQKWQDEILESFSGRGFSPLLWLTRPSATREKGLNIHPHDGNVARTSAPDAPASWSADVVAMTCNFNIVKEYSTLGSKSAHDKVGCLILAAPKKITYLSSVDIKSRHETNISHEFEVITPHIDSSDALAILFVENGKISRVELNQDVIDQMIKGDIYTSDIRLLEELKHAFHDASESAKPALSYLIDILWKLNHQIDLLEEFDSRFNNTIEELIDHTQKTIAACDAKIESMPGLLGKGLRTFKRENTIYSKAKIAEKLGIELYEEEPKTSFSSTKHNLTK